MIFLNFKKPTSWKLKSIFFGFGIFLQVLALSPIALAQSPPSRGERSAMQSELEGLRFVGPFGAEGEAKPKQDTFTFKDGKFATASCLEWGFVPAPFWTRRDSNGVHFLAELESPEHGTLRYEGMYDGKELSIVGYWKKERWYWTVEVTYRGNGRLAK